MRIYEHRRSDEVSHASNNETVRREVSGMFYGLGIGIKGVKAVLAVSAVSLALTGIAATGAVAETNGPVYVSPVPGTEVSNPGTIEERMNERRDTARNLNVITVKGCDNVDIEITQANYDIYTKHNEQRASIGVPQLCLDERLMESANAHATDMATHRYYNHVSPEGETIGGRGAKAGYCYRAIGENIAAPWGHDTSLSLHEDWMNSAGHRANIDYRDFVHVGFGTDSYINENFSEEDRVRVGDMYYSVVNFGSPCPQDNQPTPDPTTEPGAGDSGTGGSGTGGTEPGWEGDYLPFQVRGMSVTGIKSKAPRPVLTAVIKELDYDVTKSDIVVKLDGRKVAFTYNGTDRVTAKAKRKLKPGRHTFTVVVTDDTGYVYDKYRNFRTR